MSFEKILNRQIINQVMRIIKASILLVTIVLSINCFSQQLEFMGIPIRSTISDYSTVLTAHRFKARYTSDKRRIWDGGDFWKRRNCFVELYANDGTNVDHIEIRIPTTNITYEEYAHIADELLSDLSNKYGIPQIDTLQIATERDVFFTSSDLQNNLCFIVKWSLSNGELKILLNNDRVYAILMKYVSIEYINRIKEASRFKGQGSSDL